MSGAARYISGQGTAPLRAVPAVKGQQWSVKGQGQQWSVKGQGQQWSVKGQGQQRSVMVKGQHPCGEPHHLH